MSETKPITVEIRFFEELNSFLPRSRRKQWITKTLDFQTTVKDLIESFGVPHTEVDLIQVNSCSVSFSRQVRHGDLITVYPVFETLEISGVSRLQQRPLRNLRFLADVHLGKLVRYMRFCGFDVAYHRNADDPELLRQMRREDRVLLTRDRGLLMNKQVQKGYLLRSDQPTEQLVEVLRRFQLVDRIQPFIRCPLCNGSLHPISKDQILDQLEPLTARHYEKFVQCDRCGKIYWEGSHFRRLRALVDRARQQSRNH